MIVDQLNVIRAGLAAWARPLNGVVEVAENPVHTFALMQQKPGSIRVVIQFEGETKRGQYEELGVQDRTFYVVIGRGQSFAIDRLDFTMPVAGGKPLYTLLEEARDVIRGLTFDDATERTVNYLGSKPYSAAGTVFDAHQLEFSIGVELPLVVASTEEES